LIDKNAVTNLHINIYFVTLRCKIKPGKENHLASILKEHKSPRKAFGNFIVGASKLPLLFELTKSNIGFN
jgi:hypothetical protein